MNYKRQEKTLFNTFLHPCLDICYVNYYRFKFSRQFLISDGIPKVFSMWEMSRPSKCSVHSLQLVRLSWLHQHHPWGTNPQSNKGCRKILLCGFRLQRGWGVLPKSVTPFSLKILSVTGGTAKTVMFFTKKKVFLGRKKTPFLLIF